ncbi:predicted protein [Sclerotinia sclerotiorum 1980 UF-70]|uniref:Uncharacterized protein n=1 Tax=Sclerotinia sclerotiorum (strain ATCC 18683 / 1980 / Ss-1) TaxID=665079 RepID=A7E5T8_SCLS1|nr:predicted protein [Sclerotinia sclerotiorum 1980 UF-70]EDN91260.1 predicted protein [Sclerotinia sclerotiorum 1980 UF-70]
MAIEYHESKQRRDGLYYHTEEKILALLTLNRSSKVRKRHWRDCFLVDEFARTLYPERPATT